jgi:molecular chaperone GrpE
MTEKTNDVELSENNNEAEQTVDNSESTEVKQELTVEELQSKLQKAEDEIKALNDKLLRTKAEQENLRRRMERDVENAHKYALERFTNELLPIVDSMEMGLEAAQKPETNIDSIKEGSELTLSMFKNALTKFSIVEINPMGEKFNHDWHEAISVITTPDAETNSIIAVHQKGYKLNERLLRPAMVVIAK